MAILPSSLDYTEKDFDSLRARLINLIRSVFPDWTDFNVANFGNILMEMNAFVGDVLLYYQDNQARESRISTAQLRKTMLGLAKLVGYSPSGATAATAELTLTLAAIPTGSVTIAAGDTFRTLEISNPVVFQALTNATIPAGSNPPSIVFEVEHSAPSTQSVVSNELANQEYQLDDSPYIDDSMSITADNGTYSQVSDFLDSTSSDLHYTVVVDANDRATVRFGNGTNGAIPTGTINFSYKTGGGSEGNVNPGTIKRADSAYTDSFGTPVQFTVANENAASGGADRQTVDSIRELAPLSLRTLNRTVAREDFEINALAVAGVARALMLTSNERSTISENTGELYVVPDGGGTPTQTLKDAVKTQVTETYPCTLTFVVSVLDPTYLTVNITATVHLNEGSTASTVDAAIRANLAAYFALDSDDGSMNENIGFGYQIENEITYSDIYNVIRDTTGVRKLDDAPSALTLNNEARDLELEPYEFPILGTITIINAATGLDLA
jgi:uncharacterized phage protein gp47/JayE